MKITKCPSIVLKRVDEELSKLDYAELQKAKSLSLAVGISLIILITKIIERS